MATPVTVILSGQVRREQAVRHVMAAPAGSTVEIHKPKRSGGQNRLLHDRITDVARQVEWNGKKRNVEAWKDIFTAALLSATHELDVVPGINGGFVLLGLHTSELSKEQCNDLITLIEAFGAEHDVKFDDGSQGAGGANNPAREAA